MRKTIVYVLRLLVDAAEPDQLHGILRDVLSGQEQSFIDDRGLLELIHSQLDGSQGKLVAGQTHQPGRDEQ